MVGSDVQFIQQTKKRSRDPRAQLLISGHRRTLLLRITVRFDLKHLFWHTSVSRDLGLNNTESQALDWSTAVVKIQPALLVVGHSGVGVTEIYVS